MKKIIRGLVVTALFLGTIQAAKHSDKTFLMPRSQVTNLAMEYTTWHKNLHKKADTLYNGTIQVVPFYQESESKNDIGRYFGFNRGATGIENAISVGPNNLIPNPRFIIHNQAVVAGGNLVAKYSFRPDQEIYGARLSYYQDLDGLLDGLFFKLNTPLVHVQNSMNISLVGADAKVVIPGAPAGTPQGNFLDYLSGNLENTANPNRQAPLQYAKITGGSHSSTGIADIDLQLGYTFWHKEHTRAALNLALLIPTGKTPKADYIFEPIHGNGHHWGVGLGLDASLILWKGSKRSVELIFAGNYRYIFEGIEKRTLDFKRPDTAKTPASAGYYELAGEQGQRPLFPFANVLTRDIRVTPGHLFDGIINLAFTCKRFVFDVGYNYYAREAERTELRHLWENDKYAVAGITYNTTPAAAPDPGFNILDAGLGATNQAFAYAGAPANTNAAINAEHLDFSSITTPSQETHKLYGALGYSYKKWQYPIMLGVGSSYEWASGNSALEGWALWGKLGLSW